MKLFNPLEIAKGQAKKQLGLKTDLHKALLRREAQLGGQLFGPSTPTRRREFFCLDSSTWVWHEEWLNKDEIWQSKTTRYDVKADGVYKSQSNTSYKKISDIEAANLYRAIQLYSKNVAEPLYGYTRQSTLAG